MAKKEKIKLTQEQLLEAYNSAHGFSKITYYLKLNKENKKLVSQMKKSKAKELKEIKQDFNKVKNSYEVRDWNLWYGPKHSLKDVTVDIERHKVTALIGPNGSGKTTFLRSLNRMNQIVHSNVKTSGNIYFFNGTNLYSPDIPQTELTTRVGMISQKPTPFPMSIYDNVAYGPRSHGISDKKVLDEIVKQSLDYAALWTEVKDKLSDYATNLSGGQQQRLCIARTIALKPEVLLMDQPTAGLDPLATTAIENLILKLKKDFTIVLVTHNMNQAQRVSDNTLFFYKGKLIESGKTRDLFTNPKEPKVRDYILGR